MTGSRGEYNELQLVTIPDGQNVSNVIQSKQVQDAWAILLVGPVAAAGSATYTIEVSASRDAVASSVFTPLEDLAGTAITPPGVGKARVISELAVVGAWRIRAATPPSGAAISWTAGKNYTV